METPTRNLLIATLAILALMLTATLYMWHGDRGTILGVHSEVASGKFKAKLGLPEGQAEGGRYAVVNIDDGAYGDASFALVYVPPQITVHDDNVVELNTSGVGVLKHPGSAAVSRVIDGRGWFHLFWQ
ncbi:MAG: hypothetical protein KKH12_01650 [Gammaproteobacteria bacterium]|nr:hypothetical protein [Gammaproteobacteria bacterium]MBU1480357.1 hypothetical protein [Gammaproteobacteria bacterium]